MSTDIVNNYTLLCDFYELTMANGYFKTGYKDKICYFDMFFRNNPDNGGFAIACGLDQVIEYIQNLHFSEEDIAFLRSKNCLSSRKTVFTSGRRKKEMNGSISGNSDA